MDLLELKRRYESLTDDELLRIYADQSGLTEIAVSALAEEITKRKLTDEESQARLRGFALGQALRRARIERSERKWGWGWWALRLKTIYLWGIILLILLSWWLSRR